MLRQKGISEAPGASGQLLAFELSQLCITALASTQGKCKIEFTAAVALSMRHKRWGFQGGRGLGTAFAFEERKELCSQSRQLEVIKNPR